MVNNGLFRWDLAKITINLQLNMDAVYAKDIPLLDSDAVTKQFILSFKPYSFFINAEIPRILKEPDGCNDSNFKFTIDDLSMHEDYHSDLINGVSIHIFRFNMSASLPRRFRLER
eukprot:945526_1